MPNSSDSESSDDSDKGIRYKTESTRNKAEKKSSSVRDQHHHGRRRRSSSDEEYERRKRRKEKKRKREKESRHIRSDNHSAVKSQSSTRKNKYDEDTTKSTINSIKSSPNKELEEHSTIEEDHDFGPALPTHLLKQNSNTSLTEKTIGNTNKTMETIAGPMLTPHLLTKIANTANSEDNVAIFSVPQVIGPSLPPHLLKPTHDDHIEEKETADEPRKEENSFISPETIGPDLPPHLLNTINTNNTQGKDDQVSQAPRDILPKSIGPVLPPHLQKTTKEESDEEQSPENPSATVIGPTLPPHLRKQLAESSRCAGQQEYDDDDCYGPLPEGAPLTKSHIQLEERSLQLKINQLNPEGNDEPKREEWMLELPAVRAANLGLGPRTFRMKGTPDMSDRSSWTDTPEDKAKKQEVDLEPEIDIKKEAERISLQKRDKQQEEMVKKSKRSSESLVNMHKKKMKEKKKDEPATNERRPFSRDVDLQINRFDEAQKKAVLKKAQLLDDRFSSGQSKFL